MSADLSDPAIINKYQEIISFNTPTRWLLLSYGQSRDKLSLFASGQGDVEDIKQYLEGDVYFIFLREERSFALISFVPEENISGVRRARALVHSRAVGSLFKAHHAAWTVTKVDALTTDAVRAKLKIDADGNRSLPISPSGSSPIASKANGRHTPRVSDATTASSRADSPKPRRQMSDNSQFNGYPTPTSPAPQRQLPSLPPSPAGPATPKGSNYPATSSPLTPAGSPRQASGSQLQVPSNAPPRTAAQEEAAQSRAKWASEAANERRVLARQRSLMEMQREAEAEQQALYDAERSARLKRERDEALRAEMDADDRKKATEQEQARRLAADRVAEEQRRRDELSQKKALEAQRRREETAARIKREKEAEIQRDREAEALKKQEQSRLAEKRQLQQHITGKRGTGAVLLTGNLTFQGSNSMYWRRRYFELSEEGMALYKSSDTKSKRLELIPIVKQVSAMSEKHDELQAIPHSFALEFYDGDIQLFFCDTEEDKEILTSALLQLCEL